MRGHNWVRILYEMKRSNKNCWKKIKKTERKLFIQFSCLEKFANSWHFDKKNFIGNLPQFQEQQYILKMFEKVLPVGLKGFDQFKLAATEKRTNRSFIVTRCYCCWFFFLSSLSSLRAARCMEKCKLGQLAVCTYVFLYSPPEKATNFQGDRLFRRIALITYDSQTC